MNGCRRHLAVMTDYIMCNHAKALCAAVTLISGHRCYQVGRMMIMVRGGANPSDVLGDNGEACKNLNIRINWY